MGDPSGVLNGEECGVSFVSESKSRCGVDGYSGDL